jgi:NAD(P)-dependent dehydrogenase (short-subunit alcohol dehydrogenase family)
VIVASRKLEPCEAAADEVRAMGRRALAVACHVGQWDALPALVEAAYDTFGKVDVLVNNAGIAPTAPKSSEVTEDLFDKTVGVNFKGPFRLSALIGDRMVAAGSGRSSTSAAWPPRAQPDLSGLCRRHGRAQYHDQGPSLEFGPKVRVERHPVRPVLDRYRQVLARGGGSTSPAP